MRALLALLALAAAPAAAQDCPTAADLPGGVVLTFGDGDTERHFALPGGGTRVVWTDEGDVFTDLVAPSGLLLAYWDGADPAPDAGVVQRVYAAPVPEGPPGPGARVRVAGVDREKGARDEAVTLTMAWADAAEEMAFGPCRYEVLRGTVEESYDDGEPPWVMHFVHVPALGILPLLGADAKGTTAVLDAVVGIGALR